MKLVATILAVVIALAVLCVAAFVYFTRPPTEAKLKEAFSTHRSSFEQLRQMLEAESTPMQVFHDDRAWNVSGDRVKKYIKLMKEIPAGEVSRRTEHSAKPLLVVTLWASGFAGDTVHSGICWTEAPPQRQVSSLDAFLRDPKSSAGTGWVFQPIEEKWYAWTDLRTGP